MLIALIALLAIIAVLYASVGHGGASGYIAIMALLQYNIVFVRQDALILNMLVSGIAFWQFYNNGHFKWNTFLPIILASFPMAFLGGRLQLDVQWYKLVLGILLVVPAILFLIHVQQTEKNTKQMPIPLAIIIGLILGFVSGVTGIGGGVFLSPILVLGLWENQKTTAAISAPFIFINSAAGFAGTLSKTTVIDPNVIWFALATIFGGLVGAYYGAAVFKAHILRKILGTVLLIAAIKLIFA